MKTMFDLQRLVRDNISRLRPYASARHDFAGDGGIFLDANENPFDSGSGLNRYPDPFQRKLKQRLADMRSMRPTQIFVGNGSDEAIDLLFRIFCRPAIDSVIVCPPTYGMYEVVAGVNDVAVIEVPLDANFQLDVRAILSEALETTRLAFVCSPNNPTGNDMKRRAMLNLIQRFPGIVVVDEAYGDFSSSDSMLDEIKRYPNLVVLQTLSKAWGIAAARVGLAFADEGVIELLNRIKPPYNVGRPAQDAALAVLDNTRLTAMQIDQITAERARVSANLERLDLVEKVYRSDANFVLVKFCNAPLIFDRLRTDGIVVRNRSNERGCANCLRITIGAADENQRLLDSLALLDREESEMFSTK